MVCVRRFPSCPIPRRSRHSYRYFLPRTSSNVYSFGTPALRYTSGSCLVWSNGNENGQKDGAESVSSSKVVSSETSWSLYSHSPEQFVSDSHTEYLEGNAELQICVLFKLDST